MERNMTPHKSLKALGFATALLGMSTGVLRAQEVDPDSWQWGVDVYFWGASIGGETTTGDDVDIGIDDLLQNFKMGFMGTLGAKKGKLSFFGDLIYLDVGNSQSMSGSLIGNPVQLDAELDLKGYISTFGVGYTVLENDATMLDLIGGGRYLELDTKIKFSTGLGSDRYNSSDSTLDAVVGLRGQSQLNERWYADYYADIGTGQSDLTWQAAVGLGYRMKNFDIAFGYRYIYWNLNDFAPFDDLNFHGPYLGAKFRL